MNMRTAIAGTDNPSRSRRSTSISRGLSASRSRDSRRRVRAVASPEAVNEEAATAECRIAASTSSTGAVSSTNAETPVSSARKRMSSSPRDVRITMPRSTYRSRSSRASRSPSPSGRPTETVTTSGRSTLSTCQASAAESHSATISMSGCLLVSSRNAYRTRA
jgi:hypothetical protein